MLKGKVIPGHFVRILRKKEPIAEVEVSRVQREKIEVKEAVEGEMCGLALKTQRKVTVEVGDHLVFFTREIKRKKL